jgi:hypothetical protein
VAITIIPSSSAIFRMDAMTSLAEEESRPCIIRQHLYISSPSSGLTLVGSSRKRILGLLEYGSVVQHFVRVTKNVQSDQSGPNRDSSFLTARDTSLDRCADLELYKPNYRTPESLDASSPGCSRSFSDREHR